MAENTTEHADFFSPISETQFFSTSVVTYGRVIAHREQTFQSRTEGIVRPSFSRHQSSNDGQLLIKTARPRAVFFIARCIRSERAHIIKTIRSHFMSGAKIKHMDPSRLIRLRDVIDLLPISKSTWWDGVRQENINACQTR